MFDHLKKQRNGKQVLIRTLTVSHLFTSGNFRITEKKNSNTDKSMVSIIRGSFSCTFDESTSLLDSFLSATSTKGYAEELFFFSSAAENPAAQTYQVQREFIKYHPPHFMVNQKWQNNKVRHSTNQLATNATTNLVEMKLNQVYFEGLLHIIAVGFREGKQSQSNMYTFKDKY